jgi:hypothetical protein
MTQLGAWCLVAGGWWLVPGAWYLGTVDTFVVSGAGAHRLRGAGLPTPAPAL